MIDALSLLPVYKQSEIDSRHRLVIVTSQRAKHLMQGARPIDHSKYTKATSIALDEVLRLKVAFAAMAAARGYRQGRFADDPLQDDCFRAFYAEVAQRGAESGLARTYRLSCGDATVAMLFGLIEDRRFCYLVLGCDYAGFGNVSPGTLLFDRAMAHWFESGGTIFDFTIGDEAFKTAFGCVRRPMLRFRRGGP